MKLEGTHPPSPSVCEPFQHSQKQQTLNQDDTSGSFIRVSNLSINNPALRTGPIHRTTPTLQNILELSSSHECAGAEHILQRLVPNLPRIRFEQRDTTVRR
mmetsp:Transcript_44072/g.52920  ORF Transcript_44072/g.52920 Transcript_44072/m.52920 type:complete len:101 (-) Transcript_44072:33-335(-)